MAIVIARSNIIWHNTAMKNKLPAVVSFIVSKVEAGQQLQVFLANRLAISRRAAKKMLDERRVWVNRRSVWMAQHSLRVGDTIEVPKAELKRQALEAPPPKLRLLYEDADYLIIDKPAAMLSVGEGSAEELLRTQSAKATLRAVHRLDRDTTGCLLVATSDEAFEAAVQVFKTRRVTKIYHAVVYGVFKRASSTIRQELDGERAVSHVQREASSDDASFLRIRIETGRTHQIRRHLAQLRSPILGDREHGVKFARDPRLLTIPRQMLHASDLELLHPLQRGVKLQAHSPLPADFRRCLKLFEMGK